MLTMHADQDVLANAIRAGAIGYLVKDCSTEEIAEAVRMAAEGDTVLSPQLAASMLDEVRKLDQPRTHRGGAGRHQARGGGPPAHRRRLLDPRGGRAPLHLARRRSRTTWRRSTRSSTPATAPRPCSRPCAWASSTSTEPVPPAT